MDNFHNTINQCSLIEIYKTLNNCKNAFHSSTWGMFNLIDHLSGPKSKNEINLTENIC